MFNSYEFGGYLIWALGPERQVFIDGRALNESVDRDYRKILYQQDPRLLDRYGIDVVLMNSYEFVSGVMYPLAPALASPANRDWALVYQDAQALVFVRDAPNNADLIARRGLEKVHALDHWAESCAVYVAHSPDLPLCARTAAEALARAGDRERAARLLEVFRRGRR